MASVDIEPVAVLATLVVGVVIKYIFSAVVGSRRKEYRLVGQVSSLHCYPIKSCRGFSVDAGDCTDIGLRVAGDVLDRHWVVVDAAHCILTAGITPTLSLVQTKVTDDELVVDAPNMPTLRLPTAPVVVKNRVVVCSTGKAELEGLDCGDEAADWFSKFLDRKGVRLLHSAPGLKKRDISKEKKEWGSPALAGDPAAYSDFCAYLVMSETSQEEVTQILQEELPLRNFRPTIVIKGNKPFEEDEWQSIQIGDKAELRVLYSTPRCIKINVDPTKGERITRNVPLDKLRKFRCFPRYGRSPILGVSAALDCVGRVKVGDPVYARMS